jgi:hypothetical protein
MRGAWPASSSRSDLRCPSEPPQARQLIAQARNDQNVSEPVISCVRQSGRASSRGRLTTRTRNQSRVRTSDISYPCVRARKRARLQGRRCDFSNGPVEFGPRSYRLASRSTLRSRRGASSAPPPTRCSMSSLASPTDARSSASMPVTPGNRSDAIAEWEYLQTDGLSRYCVWTVGGQ